MDFFASSPVVLAALVFAVAALYASVGHGGASGYMAVMILVGSFAPAQMASTALLLNLLVAALAWHAFWRAGFFSWKLVAPFLAASVPMAFLGGWRSMPPPIFKATLAATLVLAGARFLVTLRHDRADEFLKQPPLAAALVAGAVMGFVSGAVGVGGGIFLSPLLLLAGWAGPKHTSAASAAFIWINSLVGISGRIVGGHFEIGEWTPLVAAAFAGGLLGSHVGAFRLPGVWIRRLLGAVLLVAAWKLAASLF